MTNIQEKNVSAAFSKQAAHFDNEDLANPILQWMRAEVRSSVLQQIKPGSHLLELNCGTGMDAIFFAENNFNVLATDNAPGMLAEVDKKISAKKFESKIQSRLCSFNRLHELFPQTFDGIFSNFGGLNCSENISEIIQAMDKLVRPGGIVTLVIMPVVCPWEIALALKGNFKTAFRRFNKKGASSNLEGINFKTWYYNPGKIKNAFGKSYKLIELKGLGTVMPPPYLHHLAVKYPNAFNKIKKIEGRLNTKWPFYAMADHFLISLEKSALGILAPIS